MRGGAMIYKNIFLAVLSFVILVGCGVDRDKMLEGREREKKAVVLMTVDFKKLEAQKVRIDDLFNIKYKRFVYTAGKSPFHSIIQDYKDEQEKAKLSSNPLLNVPIDEIRLTGVLSGKVGNIAVVTVTGSTYYLKVGDEIGVNRSKVLLVGSDFVRIREVSEDIFGNTRTNLREMKLAVKEDKQHSIIKK